VGQGLHGEDIEELARRSHVWILPVSKKELPGATGEYKHQCRASDRNIGERLKYIAKHGTTAELVKRIKR